MPRAISAPLRGRRDLLTAPFDKKPGWRFAAGAFFAVEKAGALTQNVSHEHQQVRQVTNAGRGLDLAGRKGSVEAGLLQIEIEMFRAAT